MTTTQLARRIKEAKNNGKLLVFAHRGVCSKAPENSVQAIALGFSMDDVDGVEFDVQETKDGYLIVRHHRAVRIGNRHEWVRDITLTEYRECVHEEISPLFETVLNAAKKSDKIIDIEIKQPGIAQKVIGMCKKAGVYNRVLLTTIYEEVYWEIRNIDSSVAVMFGYPRDRGKDIAQRKWTQLFVRLVVSWMRAKTPQRMREFAQRIDSPFYSLYHKVTTKAACDACHELGKFCIGCTISLHNDTGEEESLSVMRRMIENGVDMIKTDFPQLRGKLGV